MVVELEVASKKAAQETPPDHDEEPGVILVAREIAEWVTDISTYATRKAKKHGKLNGKKRIGNAVIVDPFLREVIWELRQRCQNQADGTPNRPIPPTPPCRLRPLEIELP